jgi:hypothetical protein
VAAVAGNLQISIDFMPAFYTRHIGLTFGDAYYFDPGHRLEVERQKGRFLREILGRYGVGDPSGASAYGIHIQSVDLVMGTQNAEWRCPPDAALESWGTPWANLSPAEIARIDPRDAAHHRIIDELIAQYRELHHIAPDRADIQGARAGSMLTHTPYTTAHQLCGEELFMLMMTEPESARTIFEKIWAIYEAIYARLSEVVGRRPSHLHLGDCSASLLSHELYERCVLPINRDITEGFAEMSYHSCGPSTHLLPAFKRLGAIRNIQLGPGTDMAQAAAGMPRTQMQPLIDPVIMRGADPESVREMISGTLDDCEHSPAVTLCVWSLDSATPIENVEAVYEVARQR